MPDLTPEQKTVIDNLVVEWSQHAKSTDPADRQRTEAALKQIYEMNGYKFPTVYWADSPMAGHKLHCQLRNSTTPEEPFYAQGESAWLGYYESFKKLGFDPMEKLTPFIELGKCCYWVWMFDEAIVCVERPAITELDDRARAHSLTKAAISWKDGYGIYMIHGIQVSEKIVLRPEEITVEDIDNERNAEVRQILINRYGEGKFIVDSGAKCTHQDEFGELYERALTDDEPLCMVRVLNSTPEQDGTKKPYWLRVRPGCQTAKEAVASTFRKTAEDYNPVAEA